MTEAVNQKEIMYAMMMKLNILHRQELPQISFQELAYAVVHGKWKNEIPKHTSLAVADILDITAEEIVTILTRLALVEGGRSDIRDFNDLMGGVKHEEEY